MTSEGHCKVVVTSRPFDVPSIDTEIDKYFKRFEILPFSMKQIVSLIAVICKRDTVEEKVYKEIEKSNLFKVLPKTPISAIILAKLLNRDIQEIPSTVTELYAKYTEIVLGRWEIDKGLSSQQEYDVILNVVINLAHYMISNELDVVGISEVRDMFNDYVAKRPSLKINNDTLFQKLINTDELLKVHDHGAIVSFVHRSFSEYFYALYLDRENEAHISEEIYSTYWQNSYFFFFGIKRDASDLIKALGDIQFSEEMAKISHFFLNGDFLLAAYLTPSSVINRCLLQAFSDAAKYFNNIVSGKMVSQLSVLPTAHLLSIFTHNMMSSYGYDFFVKALMERSLELSTINSPTDDEFAELFLINSTLVSNKNFQSFELMIDNYGKKIPILFQIGMNYVVDGNKSSPIITRYIKQTRKIVSKNSSLRASITELFEKPINEEKAKELIQNIEKLKE